MNEDGIPRIDRGPPGTLVTSDPGARHRIDDLLRRAHAELSPSSADKARGRAALGLPEPPAVLSAPTGWAALRASGKAGAVVSVISLGLAFGAGFGLGRTAPSRETPIPASASAPAPAGAAARTEARGAPATPPAAPDSTAEGELAAAGRPPGELALRGTSPANSSPPENIPPGAERPRDVAARVHPPRVASPREEPRETSRSGEELALMRRIERALRNDQPGLALALLAEVEARFPNSALEEERLAASVMAHCGLRDAGHARRAETFLESRPRSVYRTRVLLACERAAADEGKARRGDE